jgi:hypothetical protein
MLKSSLALTLSDSAILVGICVKASFAKFIKRLTLKALNAVAPRCGTPKKNTALVEI